ncbi:WhiB family transcriptional regulator [Rhodococcus sp. ZPP]|uniref:WhiB family transcriptional regulator n=1 Tax=Rhodococcus sp. ZPP TaxID=2749906 RepID=UPI00244E2007|nr:WhiB family transcriptional regulator [Rhodococcus sp. ZPP]
MSDTDPMTCISPRAPSTVPASRREDTPRTGLPVDRDRRDWRILGSCRNVESSLFFSPEGERGRDRARREAHAKRVCQDCPVLTECREYALTVAEPYGTWGGMSENDRRRHIRRRQREGHGIGSPRQLDALSFSAAGPEDHQPPPTRVDGCPSN